MHIRQINYKPRIYMLAGVFDERHQGATQSFQRSMPWHLICFECPLNSREIDSIADSTYRFITRIFSIKRLNELKSESAEHSRQKSKGNVNYTGEKPWKREGISSSTYYYRKSNSVNIERQAASQEKSWEKLNISRRAYYRKKAQGLV